MERLNSLFSLIHDFLLISLPKEQKCSENTIRSYKKALELLLDYVQRETGKSLRKISFDDIDRNMLAAFLDYLENERNCSVSTRNHRLNSIKAFYQYAAKEDISLVKYLDEIQKVHIAHEPKKVIEHMSENAIQAILSRPDTSTLIGKRDAFMMLFLYRTGVRVQELVDIRLCDIQIRNASKLTVCGKGRKFRTIPLRENTVTHLKGYLDLFHPGRNFFDTAYLFYTVRNGVTKRMTEDNVRSIVAKYGSIAKKECLEVPDRVHPHLFRHSLAMSLYRNGVDLSLVSQWLGHSDLQTTLIYAYADTEIKRQAIEKAIPKESELSKFTNAERYQISDDELLKRLCGIK